MNILGFLPLVFAGLIMLVWGLTSLWVLLRGRRLAALDDLEPEILVACMICDSTQEHLHTPVEINDYVLMAVREQVKKDEEFYQEAIAESQIGASSVQTVLDKYLPVKDPTGGEYVRDPYWFKYQVLKQQLKQPARRTKKKK